MKHEILAEFFCDSDGKLRLSSMSVIEPCKYKTRCDPAGDIQTIASLRERIGALEEQIREARSNTGCALMQTVPSDDQIIMDRVRLAHKILEEAV